MIRELKIQKGKLFNQLQDVYKVAENEKRSLASDEVAKSDKIMSAMTEKDAQIRNLQDFAKRFRCSSQIRRNQFRRKSHV